MLEFAISLAVITGLFALMFKALPDAQVAWCVPSRYVLPTRAWPPCPGPET